MSCTHMNGRVNIDKEDDINDKENEDENISRNIFTVDRSKRGTGKCIECKKNIPKDNLRIGKSVPYKSIHIQRYFHVSCAFEMFQRARLAANVISDMSQLDGVKNLMRKKCILLSNTS